MSHRLRETLYNLPSSNMQSALNNAIDWFPTCEIYHESELDIFIGKFNTAE